MLLFAATGLALFYSPSLHAQDITTGLVGHWKLDEGTGMVAVVDSAGGGTGTMINMEVNNDWVDGKSGSALQFDGVDEYVALGATPAINITDNTATIAAWVKRGTASSTGDIISKGNPGTNGYVLGIGSTPCVNVNHVKASKYGVGDSCIGAFPADTEWHHLVVRHAADTGTSIFIDGVLNANFAAGTTAINSTASNAELGTNQDLNNFFNGAIDDVRVYDRDLSNADILYLYNASAGYGICNAAHEGVMIYNKFKSVMQYCDGTNWIAMGPPPCGQTHCGGTTTERVVFIEDTPRNGNLGGLSGAHAICQTAATANGLKGSYKAWLTDAVVANAPATTFNQSSVPYKLVNGTKVADNWADLVDGTLDNAITVRANGTATSLNAVWSNTTTSGTRKGGSHCGSWTSNSAMALSHRGQPSDTGAFWTDRTAGTCNLLSGLYCFEQNPPSAITCTNPAGVEGEVDYNFTRGVMQFCNGANWVTMGGFARGTSPEDNVPTASLVGHWKFDETSGSTTAADSSGLSHTGTLTNMTPASDWVAGKINNALDFDGSNDYVSVATSTDFQIKDLTLSAWIYMPTLPTVYKPFIWKSTGGDNNFSLWKSENGNKLHYRWTGGWVGPVSESIYYMDSNADVAINTWYHVVGTYDDPTNTARLYINGVLDREKTGATDPVLSLLPIYLGGAPGAGFFGGIVDDVRIYSRDLSATEVQALYLGTGGGDSNEVSCVGMGAVQYHDAATGHCYYRGSSTATWANAKTACEANGDYLAVITSAEENNIIRDNIVQTLPTWFGASDGTVEGEWRWQGGELNGVQFWQGFAAGTPVNGLFEDWGPIEPNNGSGIEDCGSFTVHAGWQWNDSDCTNTFRYVCERSPPGESAQICSNPAGVPGEMVYNDDSNKMQYCNGAHWIAIP